MSVGAGQGIVDLRRAQHQLLGPVHDASAAARPRASPTSSRASTAPSAAPPRISRCTDPSRRRARRSPRRCSSSARRSPRAPARTRRCSCCASRSARPRTPSPPASALELTATAQPAGVPEPTGPFAAFAPPPSMAAPMPGQTFEVRARLANRGRWRWRRPRSRSTRSPAGRRRRPATTGIAATVDGHTRAAAALHAWPWPPTRRSARGRTSAGAGLQESRYTLDGSGRSSAGPRRRPRSWRWPATSSRARRWRCARS